MPNFLFLALYLSVYCMITTLNVKVSYFTSLIVVCTEFQVQIFIYFMCSYSLRFF